MILVVLFLGLMLRVISLNQSLWLDEAINILAVKNYSFIHLITQYAQADFHPPGWIMVLWVWAKAFGCSEVSTRMPSVIFGVITIFVVYLIGQKLVSKKLGLIAALFLAINPLHVYYSQEARMYSLATLAVSINIFILLKLIKEEKVNLFFLILSNFLVLLSDYVAYFIFPAQLLLLLIIRKKGLIKKWFTALFAALLLIGWWIPIFLSQFNVGSLASANLPSWKLINGGFDFKTLPLTFIKFIIGRISLVDKTAYYLSLLPVCLIFGYSIYKGIKLLGGISRKLMVAWIIIPPSIATIISLFIPVYNYFRVLFVLPAFVILVSAGILSFKGKVQYGFLITVAAVEIFCTLFYLSNPFYQREDWRGLVNYFQKKPESVLLFESSGILPPVEYYGQGKLRAKGALKDFPARTEKDVLNLRDLLQNEKEVYLVDYLVQISDPQRLAAQSLGKAGFTQTDVLNFNGVGFVYHFEKNE